MEDRTVKIKVLAGGVSRQNAELAKVRNKNDRFACLHRPFKIRGLSPNL